MCWRNFSVIVGICTDNPYSIGIYVHTLELMYILSEFYVNQNFTLYAKPPIHPPQNPP